MAATAGQQLGMALAADVRPQAKPSHLDRLVGMLYQLLNTEPIVAPMVQLLEPEEDIEVALALAISTAARAPPARQAGDAFDALPSRH